MELFNTATRTWFRDTFGTPTAVQAKGWVTIARGEHSLLVAPTGSGKTLAAFLWAIDRLIRLPPESTPGVRVLYVSPLKALVYDVERNLRAPLMGILRTAEHLGVSGRQVGVAMRTGDTSQKERLRQVRYPAEILVTTPESLFLLLGSSAREALRSVHTVIIDEVHALAPTKRGAHLALSLERLVELTAQEPQRIGLSATLRPLEEAARFLGGQRAVARVDASRPPHLELEVTVPVPDMEQVRQPEPETEQSDSKRGARYARESSTPQRERGIWPTIYPELLKHIRTRRTTIIFVNSRGLCERLAQRLNELAGEALVRAHHGSVSHQQRLEIEAGLKRGTLRGIVATSSLELGIDMGAVELVILVESPGSVVRGLQRVGRARHQVGGVSAGRLFPKFRGDLLECTVIAQRMLANEIETIRVPQNPLDVLAQQLVAICCDGPCHVFELASIVERSYPFHQLSRQALQGVLDMLAGTYPSSELADLRPLLSWDRARDTLTARRGAPMVSRLNAGTIPDRGNYAVHLGAEGPRIGELDEEMVFETRPGENIQLGASTWRVEQITRDRVLVSPAPGEPGRLPFWRGQGPGRPLELGRAIGAFIRHLGAMKREQAVTWLGDNAPLGRFAAENLAAYIFEQRAHTGALPTDRLIVIERFRDELGDWRVCILTPFGARIHAPWAMSLQRSLSHLSGFEVQLMYTDDGIVLRFADVEKLPGLQALLPDPGKVEELVTEQLADTALFAGLFRENAVRALLMPRRRGNKRQPLWAQRLKAQQLLATVQRHPAFPIVLETYRQCLSDVFDLPGLKGLLADIRTRRVQVVDVETPSASPFARSLVFAYVATYIYEQDAPIAERKAQALTLDRNLLNELLGQAELRELIDPEVLATLEAELQHFAGHRHARDKETLHDLLRRLGDMTEAELQARSTQAPRSWLEQLQAERRVVEIRVEGEHRWIAAEDAGLYRDTLGVMPPSGLPDSHLASAERPLEQLLRRFARTHGPFLTGSVAQRYGLRPAQLEPILRLLETESVVVSGEIRPGGAELDWCDVEVLRRLRHGTLAKLRHEVAPVESTTLGLFLPEWHGIGADGSTPDRLHEAIEQLEALALPWSALSQLILPARIPDFSFEALDRLSASGAVVWVGHAPLGARDGRVALYHRSRVPSLLDANDHFEAPGEVHAAILGHLENHGACFLTELQQAVKLAGLDFRREDFDSALWDLVWAGQITNDTFAPLRALSAPSTAHRHGPRTQALAGGRWSLLTNLFDSSINATEQALARAQMLLERYGVVSREMVQAEELAGGFGPIYRVLKQMEEKGRVVRGYFVEGLTGAQFGQLGAVERLRAARLDAAALKMCDGDDVLILAALDPANPYGALLPWPNAGSKGDLQPRRIPGAWVMLVDGKAVLYVSANARQLITFPAMVSPERGELVAAFLALNRLPRLGRRSAVVIEKIDGVPVYDSPHYQTLKECGFESDYKGLTPASRYV